MSARELLSVVDIDALLGPHPPRTNFNLFWIDDAYTMRVANLRGAFPWHYHPKSDEAWLVLRGRLRVRTECGDVELGEHEATVIPPLLRHSPVALEPGTQVLIVNSRSFTTVYTDVDMDHVRASYREIDLDVHP